jgi:hypothetical protein
MTLSLYTLHSTPREGEFIIQKFDTDYTCESVYAMTSTTCSCPQGHKPSCRHRTMFPLFLKFGHINDGWFLQWENRMWRRPVNDIPVDVPEEMVTRSTAAMAEDAEPSPAIAGADQPAPAAPPPSPPEGGHPAQAAEAAPARPVGVGALVKRRKIP